MMAATNKYRGFSLVELTIVLVIVALLVGSMIKGFTTYQQNRLAQQTHNDLKLIHDALLGFAIQNQRLPCPVDPSVAPNDGREDPPGGVDGCDVNVGFLPFLDLGVSGVVQDPWGNAYAYAVDSIFADNTSPVPNPPTCPAPNGITSFDICDQGQIEIHSDGNQGPGGCDLPCVLKAQNVVAVFYSFGESSFTTFSDHEKENFANALGGWPSDSNDLVYVKRQYSRDGANKFDDHVMWIPSTILMKTMIDAGRLP